MREFQFDELARYKCVACGSKNKLYTELIDRYTHKLVGYTTRCCNCGHKMTWTFNTKADIDYTRHHSTAGKSICIQPSYCPYQDCRLFGTCDFWHVKPKRPMPPKRIKKSHFDELTVNDVVSEKYR